MRLLGVGVAVGLAEGLFLRNSFGISLRDMRLVPVQVVVKK